MAAGDQNEATVQELTAEDVSRNASGWLHHTCNRLFHKDMFAHMHSSDTLPRIHSTAEQLDPAAEALSGPFQVSLPACCSLLALCTRPVSLSACPLHLPCVSLCFCHYLSPNGVCFAINFCDSPVKWSPYTVMIDVWLHASMSQLGLQASLQAVRDQNFVAVALKLALRLAFQNPLASWSISNGSSNYNVVLCTALAATTVSSLSSMCSVCTVQTANPPVHIHLGCPEPAAVAGCHVQRAQPLGQRHFSLSLLDCFESLVTWCMIICASIDTHFVL